MSMTYDEVIDRVGFFRNRANLSMREASQRLGYNAQFMNTIENQSIELKVKTLLDFCDVVGISIEEFFYLGEHYDAVDAEVLALYRGLSTNSRRIVIELMKNMK